MAGCTFLLMNSTHFGQVGSLAIIAWNASGVPGRWRTSGPGILNLRFSGFLPWQVTQLKVLNSLASNA
jgi:hypothetical protein